MGGRRTELRHVSKEGARVRELSRRAAHVVLLEKQLDEACVLLGGGVDVLCVQQSRRETPVRDEALRVDRHGRPQESPRGDPVGFARQHSGPTTKGIDLYVGRDVPRIKFLNRARHRRHSPASPH